MVEQTLTLDREGKQRTLPKEWFMHVGVSVITRSRRLTPTVSLDLQGPLKIPVTYPY